MPSTAESALFGTKLMDEHFPVQVGGDAAFFTGALKHLLEGGRIDREFVARHTEGFDELAEHVVALGWSELEAGAGVGVASGGAAGEEASGGVAHLAPPITSAN